MTDRYQYSNTLYLLIKHIMIYIIDIYPIHGIGFTFGMP